MVDRAVLGGATTNGCQIQLPNPGSPMTNENPSPAEPRWKFIQRVVAVLEHMLAPRAIVRCGQFIKDIDGNDRECDVTVWYGAPPRLTLAEIVEVQDRGSKVGLQTFEGWCAKRQKLGGPRLICVSCEGFTEDVERAAANMGDVIGLVTLCESDQKPPFLATTPPVIRAAGRPLS